MNSRVLTAASLIFALTGPRSHADECWRRLVSCTIGSCAYRSVLGRTEEELTLLQNFKSRPDFRDSVTGTHYTRNLDLTDPNLLRIVPREQMTGPAIGRPDSYDHASPMQAYESEVLNLSSGDQVTVEGAKSKGRRTIVLEQYLNAGNSNHIWSEAGAPDVALRIPFPAGETFMGDLSANIVAKARMLALTFVRMADEVSWRIEAARRAAARENPEIPLPRVVRIHDYGARGEFVEVDRVSVERLGSLWLAQAWPSGGSEPRFAMARSLLLAIDHVTPVGRQLNNELRRQAYLREARQYAWDGDTWVLLDWE
jgi:hypothetical protein